MAHTIRDKKKLLNRVRRVRGQIEAVERLLENESECDEILQQIAACRGSINGLMCEVLEGHIRFHLVERRREHKSAKSNAVDDVISIAKSSLAGGGAGHDRSLVQSWVTECGTFH
jgi:DNA-binding FrmR family transcriptional regulator